jgi:hypothetical protein
MQLVAKSPPLIEKNGKLVRADLGGEYVFDQVLEFVKGLRGASYTEFADGRSAARSLIARSGGPLYILSHGDVTAKVAPYQGWQRLWRVLHGKREVITGSFVSTYGNTYFTPIGTPTESKVEMEGEQGWGAWAPYANLKNIETIAQDADGTLHWEGSMEQIRNVAPLTSTIVYSTSYPAKNLAEAQKYTLEYETPDGWKPVPYAQTNGLPKGEDFAKPIENFKLRITTPDGKIVIHDTYQGSAVYNVAWAYNKAYAAVGMPARLNLCLLQKGVKTEFKKPPVPAFKRSIKVETAE